MKENRWLLVYLFCKSLSEMLPFYLHFLSFLESWVIKHGFLYKRGSSSAVKIWGKPFVIVNKYLLGLENYQNYNLTDDLKILTENIIS